MADKYERIRKEIERKKGTDGPITAEHFAKEQYADRHHFVLELLQNTEDALSKATCPSSGTVHFALSATELTVSHFGKPFDRNDVLGLCSFLDSTKDPSQIGHFGIGFKSVFNVTDCPVVHSGEWHFEIRDYLFPHEIEPERAEQGQTLIQLRFKDSESNLAQGLLDALEKMQPETLLFLKHIREVVWTADKDLVGSISVELFDEYPGVQRRTMRRSRSGLQDKVTQYLVTTASPPPEENAPRQIELAWLYGNDGIEKICDGSLFVAFPTSIRTNLGFHIQGPFDPIASRDTIKDDDLNRSLMGQAADLLAGSLEVFKENNLLTVGLLATLPLAPIVHDPRGIYTQFHNAVKSALADHEFLPTRDGGWARSGCAFIATNPKFIDLGIFSSSRKPLAVRVAVIDSIKSQLHTYHDVRIVDWGWIFKNIKALDLERRSDDWVRFLYEVALEDFQAFCRRPEWMGFPWVRLADGRHVVPKEGDTPRAYLSSDAPHIFPPIRQEVIEGSPQALKFVESSLGVKKPLPIDVLRKEIIPRYKKKTFPDRDSPEYANDLRCFTEAFSSLKAEEATSLFQGVCWIPVRLGGDDKWWGASANEPNADLEGLFEGIYDSNKRPVVTFLDDVVPCLKDPKVRRVLNKFLQSDVPTDNVSLSEIPPDLLKSVRLRQNADGYVSQEQFEGGSKKLRHLDLILNRIGELQTEDARRRSGLLWQTLAKYPQLRQVRYFWKFSNGTYADRLPNPTILKLRSAKWVPVSGALRRPCEVTVDELPSEWQRDADLEALIQFKGTAVAEAAKMVGLNASHLNKLKNLGDAGMSDHEIDALLSRSTTEGTSANNLGGEPDLASVGSISQAHPITQADGGAVEVVAFGEGTNEHGEATPPTGRRTQFKPGTRPGGPVRASAGPVQTSQERRDEIGAAGVMYVMNMDPRLQEAPPQQPGV